MQFLNNRVRFLYPNFLVYMGEILQQFLIKKIILVFFQSYGYINILSHIFNSARNNQQQLVIFIHVMVSASVCFGGKEILHFIPDKTKVNAKLYVETLLPELVQDCRSVLSSGFIFQQDGVPTHTAKLAQDWIATNCSKSEWPPNSPDLNPLDYHVWGAMLERYKPFQPKPDNIDELKKVLQLIWDQLPCTRLDQQSQIELPEKTSGLCESWW